jgi:hypothetical protein
LGEIEFLDNGKNEKKRKNGKFWVKSPENRNVDCRRGGFPCPPDQAKPENRKKWDKFFGEAIF